jgi:hypothetical protein
MRWVVFLVVSALLVGCDRSQPESNKTVAAFLIPLPSENDRGELLIALRGAAKRQGMHVDAAGREDLERMARNIPEAKKTIYAAVWFGSSDDDPVAIVTDQNELPGQVWIMFLKGKNTVAADKFRGDATREIMRHWPDTLSLPITPTGGIPLYRDLIRTSKGYMVTPSAASRYSQAHDRP